jgi:hypothetical protein
MSRLLFFLVMLSATTALAQTLLVNGPSGNLTGVVKDGELLIDGQKVSLPKVRLGWYFNGSYTVFGIYYGNPDCTLGTYPNAPKFYIQCTAGTDITVVALKDAKAKVVCKEKNQLRNPTYTSANVEIYTTKGLGLECESSFPAVVSTPNALISALAGLTAASATLVLTLGVMLLRRAFFKQQH